MAHHITLNIQVILSHFYLEKQKSKQHQQVKALKRASPIAWPHINIIGRYFFRKTSILLSFSKINELVKPNGAVKLLSKPAS